MANCIFSREGSLGISRRRPWISQTAFLFLLASVPKKGERREWGLDGVKCPQKTRPQCLSSAPFFLRQPRFGFFRAGGRRPPFIGNWGVNGAWVGGSTLDPFSPLRRPARPTQQSSLAPSPSLRLWPPKQREGEKRSKKRRLSGGKTRAGGGETASFSLLLLLLPLRESGCDGGEREERRGTQWSGLALNEALFLSHILAPKTMLVWQRVRSPPLRIFKRFYFPPPSSHFLRRLPFFLFFSACGRTSVVVGFFCLFAPFFPLFLPLSLFAAKQGRQCFLLLYILRATKRRQSGGKGGGGKSGGEKKKRESSSSSSSSFSLLAG